MLPLHLVAVLGIVGTGYLGAWQFGAWADHRQDKAAALADAAPMPLTDVLGPDEPFPSKYVGQPVTFNGTWLPEDTVYVADKEVDGRSGYWVVTPVSTSTGSAMPVVRGWSQQHGLPAPTGAVRVQGWLQPGESSGEADEDPGDDVLPTLRIADVLARMDQDLYGGYVIAKEPREQLLTAVTPDQLPSPSAFTSLRNLLYALEWWVFGAFAVFLWWRWCTDELQRVRSVTAGQEADEPEVPSSA